MPESTSPASVPDGAAHLDPAVAAGCEHLALMNVHGTDWDPAFLPPEAGLLDRQVQEPAVLRRQ